MNKQIINEKSFSDSNGTQILEESLQPGGQYKCIFRAKLQEADNVNNNKRVYPAETLEAIYEQLKDKADERKLLSELDHPQSTGDSAAKIKRSSTISLERACMVITRLEWDGNSIYGICETLSNRAGMDLYCLLKDKVTIGFSLRAFGETRNKGGGVVEVIPRGIKGLTWDCVSNPSHDSSVIVEMIQESEDARSIVKELKLEVLEETQALQSGNSQLLEEGSAIGDQIVQDSSKQVCIGNICSVAPLEEAIEYITNEIVSSQELPKVKVSKF